MKTKLALFALILLTLVLAAACATPPGPSTGMNMASSGSPNSSSNGAANAATTTSMAQSMAGDTSNNSVPPPPYAKHQTYDPTLPPASADKVKEVTLRVTDTIGEVADGVPVDLWTFNGTAPGPIIHVNLGDTIKFTLINDGKMAHSIDFHAAQTAWNINYAPVQPGQKLSFEFKANYPGVFMYHCGTPPVIFHIANGMFGAIVVTPPNLHPVAKEYVLVQSEFYVTKGSDGLFHTDGAKLNAIQPDYVVFNGYFNQYQDAPLTANPGDRIRLWVVNAGPTTFSAFHVIGALFDTAYADGNPQNEQHGAQTVTIPPGGAYMVELVIPDAGLYPFVTHSFAFTGKGALGLIKVGDGGVAAGADPAMAHMSH